MKVLTALIIGVALALLSGWAVMIAAGILGFALSYGSSLGLSLVASLWVALARLGES